MLDNALLRDPDRGLAHFKDTLRPYFVKGVNHVFLWRFLQMFCTYRGQNEFVHWIVGVSKSLRSVCWLLGPTC